MLLWAFVTVAAPQVKRDGNTEWRLSDHQSRSLISAVDSDSIAALFPSIDSIAADSTAALNDSMAAKPPTPDGALIRRQKVDLDNIVNFKASDSMVLMGRNDAFMYGNSEVTYGTMKLNAAKINMEMSTNNVNAFGMPDSAGVLSGTPIFTDKSGEYESETMRYNFKSQRGFITNVVTEQGE